MAGDLPYPLAEEVKQGITAINMNSKASGSIHIYEQIALAWTTQRQIRIHYQSLQSSETKEWLLEPYFMEMTGVGYSSYVIGQAVREGKEGIITFKLDRIKKARLTEKHFEIPANVDIGKLLSSSWGIIWGDDVDVVLKFSQHETRRVKETVWHPSQIITSLPEGGCLMKLKIGSLLEITPWIRSWGPDVEVLTPESLRQDFSNWAEQWHSMYCRK
jgi:predicted DNA-binding transcriptional regulator YafY